MFRSFRLTRSMRETLHYNHAEEAWCLGEGIFLHRPFGRQTAHIFVNPKMWKKKRARNTRRIKGACPKGQINVFSIQIHFKNPTVRDIQALTKNSFTPKSKTARFACLPIKIWVKKIKR